MSEINQIYVDAAQMILGSMLQDKAEAAEIFISMRSSDFIFDDHKLIFDTAAALFAEGVEVSPITIGARTSPDIHKLCKDLVMITPSAHVWDSCAKVVRDFATLERAKNCVNELHTALDTGTVTVQAARQSAEQLSNLLGGGDRNANVFSATQLATEFFTGLDSNPVYLDWGFDKLNRHVMCEGNEYIILGARPSVGKTALSLQIAQHIAQKKRVGFFSLETDRKKIAQRIMSCEAIVPLDAIKRRTLTKDQLNSLALASQKISRSKLQVIEAAGYTPADIRRDVVAQRLEVVIVDYLQLVCTSNHRQSEYERVSEVSRALQMMAKSLGIIVIALSQLSRNIDQYTEPDCSDLRSSGQIEQDADAVLLMYIPPYEELKTPEEKNEQDSLRRLKIAKCKEGVTGKIKMWFNGSIQHFAQEWPDFYKNPVQEVDSVEQLKIGG